MPSVVLGWGGRHFGVRGVPYGLSPLELRELLWFSPIRRS